ncbi:LysR family transcriptional regulator [Rheinheimera sp. UJ63]|uniref:LysR family transcriptional regulator n=1 Tax=Rheinheimera sp. UJ63 TaxID=2910157 RepID=UPI001F2F202E|nr:LysR family transcriptional regulator [Rheinheimera sp. UJ63]MCF4010139.1 LysR family transcriptional regulator [Rheinheimera sp. UJ63]
MNLKQLRYFIVTADYGSIASAARALDVAQPAVSQQLANLEHELKSTLLMRNYRGVTLTASGQVFYDYATEVLQQFNSVRLQIHELEQNLRGAIVIGMTQAVCNILAAPLQLALQQHNPDIELIINTAQSSTLQRWLEQGEVDLVISYLALDNHKSCRTVPLLEERFFLVFSGQVKAQHRFLARNKLLPFQRLAEFEISVPNQRSALWEILHRYEAETGVKLMYKNSVGQLITGLPQMIEQGQVFILPSPAFYQLVGKQLLYALPIADPDVTATIALLSSLNRPFTPIMEQVQQLIVTEVKNLHNKGHWQGNLLC